MLNHDHVNPDGTEQSPADPTRFTLYDGSILRNVHLPDECFLPNCCIHNPSDHPLKDAPLSWMGGARAMFRVCKHGFHHPDPDDMAFKRETWAWMELEAICSVHLVAENCDGCCQPSSELLSAGSES